MHLNELGHGQQLDVNIFSQVSQDIIAISELRNLFYTFIDPSVMDYEITFFIFITTITRKKFLLCIFTAPHYMHFLKFYSGKVHDLIEEINV